MSRIENSKGAWFAFLTVASVIGVAAVVGTLMVAVERDQPPVRSDAGSEASPPVATAAAVEEPVPAENDDTATVTEITIGSDDQMQFDTERFRVPAGATITLTLEHDGQLPVEAMGHNVVIINPDEDPVAFGTEVQEQGGDLDNDYVPEPMRDRVIAFTRMIGGGEADTIEFEAPDEPDDYPFICSFPGHYTMMQGVMTVVDADAEPDVIADAPDDDADDGPVHMRHVDQLPNAHDPHDPAWDDIQSTRVEVQPQNMVRPTLTEPTIEHITLQAVRNDDALVWRLSWEAEAPIDMTDTARFSDGVALQIPLAPNASFMMGSPGQPVHILYWRAHWQRDVDEGYTDLAELYPHFWSDLYWFAEGEYPYPIGDAFQSDEARQWMPAISLGNPMANVERVEPVEEIVAEGPGSITSIEPTHARANGSWSDGRWTVVLTLPLDRTELVEALSDDGPTQVSLAVWDGIAENVGGRKHYSIWVPVESD